jgi:hypothetical protein
MAQAAAARKKQEVPSARRTASRTHVTATGCTSTDRSVGGLSAARCALSAALFSAALLSGAFWLHPWCLLHIVCCIFSVARCLLHVVRCALC